jgi:ribulose kinase
MLRKCGLRRATGSYGNWLARHARAAGSDAASLPRLHLSGGYKGLWSATGRIPSAEFLATVHPKLVEIRERKLPGTFVAPGKRAGALCESLAANSDCDPGSRCPRQSSMRTPGFPGREWGSRTHS